MTDQIDDSDLSLPPEGATVQQLYVLMQLMRKDQRVQTRQLKEQAAKIESLTDEVTKVKTEFEKSRAVVSAVKWIAGLGTAIIAIVGGFKALFS